MLFNGYKMHIILNLMYQLIRKFEVTTAEVHDSQICFNFTYTVMYSNKSYFRAEFP
jgi:IS5 family transposase